MSEDLYEWTEADSEFYQEIAAVAVPARAEQIATLLTMLPFSPTDSFQAVEVGCGQGILSAALLSCYPQANIIALDGSEAMRAETTRRLSSFNGRGRVEAFDLGATEWHAYLDNADCVLSSLCLHHLTHEDKRKLYATIGRCLSNRGALLIADLVEPQRPEGWELFAAGWDRATEVQSVTETGSTDLFEKFRQSHWNYYRYPDPYDKPSPLFDQLLWLKEAGFTGVDCFWLQAGHAIYGGYKTTDKITTNVLSFELALRAAQSAMKTPG
jgi:tRNA (cmo5U34)-methyltransferase